MPFPLPPGIGERELRGILAELETLFRPAAPPPPTAAPAAPSAYVIPAELVLPLPEPPRPKPSPPPAAPAAPPPLPPDDIPAQAGSDQIRRVAVLCSADCAAETAAVLSYLQEIGRKVSKPIFLSVALAQELEASTHAAYVAIKAHAAGAIAALVVARGFAKARREEWEAALDKKRLRFHWIDPASIRERALLVDIMSDLLVVDPLARERDFSWEGHGFDDTHGIRR